SRGGWSTRSGDRVGPARRSWALGWKRLSHPKSRLNDRAAPTRPRPAGSATLPGTGRERASVFGLPSRDEVKRAALLSLITTALCLIWPVGALAQEVAQGGSAINIDLGTGAGLTQRVVQLVGLMTVLSLAPSIVIMTTSFVRIVVVLSLLRTA